MTSGAPEKTQEASPHRRARLDVVIVTRNGRELAVRCLDSLVAETGPVMHVVVVDNASTDGLPRLVRSRYPAVELIETGANLGFGRAANIGIRHTRSEFVLLLNPDTEVSPGSITLCVDALRGRPEVGILGCKLVKLDGTLDHACKRDIPTPLTSLEYFVRRLTGKSADQSRYTAATLGADDEGYVGAVNGAFMLVRRAAIRDVGLFDERFWMYGEDLDWCYRFARHGWRILYWPSATVVHVKAGISGARRRPRVNVAFHHSMWMFYCKHYSVRHPLPLRGLILSAIMSKMCASLAGNEVRRFATRLRAAVGRWPPAIRRASGDT